jgi:hypothetical protein
MSIKSKLLWLGLGGGLIAVFVKESRRRAAPRPAEAIPADPEIEAALDLASLDLDEEAGEIAVPETVTVEAMESPPDDDVAMKAGQNWVEALETDAIEDGFEPEKPLRITDDTGAEHSTHDLSASDDDIPVADRGAGGPGGI